MSVELTPAEHALIVAALRTSTRSPAHLAFLAAPAVEQIIAARFAAMDEYMGWEAGHYAATCDAALNQRP